MTLTLLLNILIENKLNENNYKEWKKNLIIVLSCKKLKTGLHTKCPSITQVEARKHWEESDEIVRCYMMASMTSTLYKQLKSCKTAKTILDKLEDMFGGQAPLARQSVITNLMNVQQKPNTSNKDNMMTLMGNFPKALENEANLDQNTQIEMVFKSLAKHFASYRTAYNLGNKNLTLTQLMKELQSY
ncbi:uncharacterized protein [Gossypium hirsutum]|uniref:Uncharacterized protein n=1 Tax=Gossypium hirsutum TaxID=3635 RepID=A0A1U8P8C2_GOSHI|nr:uncharacterized protein LOC107956164 [Gossypium hirsutum]